MITEDYVSFETAKLLKNKGFNGVCRYYYPDSHTQLISYLDCKQSDMFGSEACIAPTQSMAMKWLREEKRTAIIIEFDVTKRGFCPYVHQLDYDMEWVVKWRINMPMKYEEAVEAGIKYCLKNLI